MGWNVSILALYHYMLTATGTEYGIDDIFDLTKMQPYNLEKLYTSFTKYSNEIVLYLPRNSDLNQIARYAQDGKKLEVAHYAIMGASKVCSDYRVPKNL
jgi:trimethylguanosine synthase